MELKEKKLYEDEYGAYYVSQDEKVLKVTNFNDYETKIEFYDFKINYNIYSNNALKGHFVAAFKETFFNNIAAIGLINENISKLFLYNIDTHEIVNIYNNRLNLSDIVNPPIIITGYMGGGTSLLTKVLKYKNIFFGSDSGVFESRKPHESITFRNLSVQHNLFKEREAEYYINEINNFLYFFWGGLPNDEKWGFKIPNLNTFSTVLCEIFPEAKFISIIKESNENAKTPEGIEFHEASKYDKVLAQRPILKGNKILHIEFEKVFNNNGEFKYLNEVFKYLNIPEIQSVDEYNDILDNINYERE